MQYRHCYHDQSLPFSELLPYDRKVRTKKLMNMQLDQETARLLKSKGLRCICQLCDCG